MAGARRASHPGECDELRRDTLQAVLPQGRERSLAEKQHLRALGVFWCFFLQFSVMTPGVAPRSYTAVPEGTVTQCRSGQELPGMRISSVGVATKDIFA